ncbi:hypothetical protein niasHT_011025 [Heterodera trifolii]|uniref:Uncharacterized protein n=1 Tax=Heterodera trifolii TaxID=157864 RepID=A0ABD2L9A7_9BILA
MKIECNGRNCEEGAANTPDKTEKGLCTTDVFPSFSAPGTPSPHGPSASLPPAPTPSPQRKVSAAAGTNGGQTQMNCLICADKATGKHYGSISKNCVVDKNQRNACRRCRFDKCLSNGMRPEAVQLERDRIAATRRNGKIGNQNAQNPTMTATTAKTTTVASAIGCCFVADDEFGTSSAIDNEQIVQRLMEAERMLKGTKVTTMRREKQPQGTTTSRESGGETKSKDSQRTATTGDVTDSMHQQLILLVQWAKHLPEFRRLPLRSQIALLRHFSAQHLILCAAFRSLVRVAASDAVWLANDRCVPRDAPKIPDINRVVARILDHLTSPMRRLRLEECEFVALKAVAFFDPMAKGIDESSVGAVEGMRHHILAALEHQVQRRSECRAAPLRLGNLLLLLPPLVAIARDLVEEAQLAKLFGLANVDELMVELLLPEDAETRSYSRLRTSVTSTIVQSNVTSPTPSCTPQQDLHALAFHGTSPSPTALPPTNGGTNSTKAEERRQQQTNPTWVSNIETG